ncbi:UDP-N-acetylenolpyruvoylglucosamine reductase [Anaerosporobacter sp.]|uniref:UDP-N-acetylenolpyruvoylglucosamine reductase n=1 Tax=Anaerosporobacter sp. TaxID=1872529 RepID=UPI00286EEDFE|nr:UDP-N-acetylenolpyruvoylglucosamine reductase [Anaerosporobacter sp.]
MTKIKEDAIRMIQKMPDDKVIYILKIMEGINGLYEDKEMQEREAAFQKLEELRKSVPDLDYEKELAESREERYANFN